MYVYVLALLRLAGKRTINTATPLDLLVSTVIGDMFDDIFWADIPLAQGVVGMTTIMLLHTLVAYATWKSGALHDLVTSRPVRVVWQGRLERDGLRHERTRDDEVRSSLRLRRIDRLADVRAAAWEPSGQLAVQKQEEAKAAEKRDRPALKAYVHES